MNSTDKSLSTACGEDWSTKNIIISSSKGYAIYIESDLVESHEFISEEELRKEWGRIKEECDIDLENLTPAHGSQVLEDYIKEIGDWPHVFEGRFVD